VGTFPSGQLVAIGCAIWTMGLSLTAAQGFTRQEALAAVYRDAEIRAERLFLTSAQLTEVAVRSGTPQGSPLIARYLAVRDGAIVGRAYVDTHNVRTKRESLLISLDSKGQVIRVDVTAFLEPQEYRAPRPWLDQYRRHSLEDDLQISRAIRPISGATLTARATNSAVRRVLSIDEILRDTGDQP
jgi:electron transport complex protein RnfG